MKEESGKKVLVNYWFISSINRNNLELDNGRILPVSRQRLKEVKDEFQSLSLKF